MKLKRIKIDRIRPASFNPRVDLKPGDPMYEKLRRSTEEFGCVVPLVVNEQTGNLVGGHQRLKVLQEQGIEEVDVVIVDLSPEKEKALNIALNRIQGDWDKEKLADLLDELTQIPEFDVELSGFDQPDIDALIAEVRDTALAEKEETFDVQDALDEEGPAITQPGEVIVLGRHCVLCGDSSRAENLEKVVDGRSVDLLFTDPPFNCRYLGGSRPQPQKARPKRSRNWKRIYNDDLDQDDYERLLAETLGNVKSVLAPGAPFYVFNGWRQFGPMVGILEGLGFYVSCVITWAKETFAIGYGDYSHQVEFCLYGWLEGKGAHRWFGPTNETTLWEVRRDPTRDYCHPTQKPLELAERAMRNSTRPGDLVLDPYLGSGSTLIAAEKIGRRCVGIELDPRYVDAVVRRYIAFLGEENVPAELAERYRVTKEVGK